MAAILPTGDPIIAFDKNGHTFAVHKARDNGELFVGLCDGVVSITGSRPDIAARALVKKHISGLPEGELVDFAKAKLTIRGATAPA